MENRASHRGERALARRRLDEAVAWEHEVSGGTYGAPRIRHALMRAGVDVGVRAVAHCYLAGVSTRRMDKLVKTLGITGLSKSQVSRMAADLDEHVDEFRHRPLGDAGPFTFVAADALTMKVREGGRVVSCAVLVATGVNNDGHREVLGCAYLPVRPLQPGRSSSLTWSPGA